MALDRDRRLKGKRRTGAAIVQVMQAAPLHDVDIEPSRARMPVRDVELSADEGGTSAPSGEMPAKGRSQ